MSEINKEKFDMSFEQKWLEAFEGAELSPSKNLWDKIDTTLSQHTPDKDVGKGRYFLFSILSLLLFSGIFIHKTTHQVNKHPLNANSKLHEANFYYSITPELPIQTTEAGKIVHITNNLPTQTTEAGKIVHITNNLPTQTTEAGKIVHITNNLPTQITEAGKIVHITNNSPTQTIEAGKIDSILTNTPTKPINGNWLQHLHKKITRQISKSQDSSKHNILKPLPVLAFNTLRQEELCMRKIDFVAYAKPTTQTQAHKFWIAFQRGVTLASPKLTILYDKYLQDYAQLHALGDDIDLSGFFTDITEKAQYSLANQADVRFGCQFNAHWQFSAGIQYRAEFLEQSTNAFFVNYYDYSRHSFLLDILEGNINSPNFVQAIKHHPSYRPNEENAFSILQFNQQSLIHIASRFEYIGIPMQVGYTLNPFQKLAFTILGAAQVDKLVRSSTSSYELQDNVAIAYRLNTATKISTWSWQIGAGAQAEYRYSPHWALTANSMYFQNIKAIKETKYALISPRGLQVNMGVKYMF